MCDCTLHTGAAGATPHAGPLTLGVVSLIVVAAVIAGATCWRARAAWRGARDFRLPRRGTSALLLGAISAVLLVLVSTSQQRLPSLTIVSHAGTGPGASTRAHLPAARREVSGIERSSSPRPQRTFGVRGGRGFERRRWPVTVSHVMRARWRPAP